MDLIHKQDGLLSVHAQGILRLLYNVLHILFPGYGGIDLAEPGAGGIGDHLRQGGFSRSRRAVKDHRAQLVGLDGPVQQLILSYYMVLSHHLVQGHRPHPRGQRCFLFHRICPHIIK